MNQGPFSEHMSWKVFSTLFSLCPKSVSCCPTIRMLLTFTYLETKKGCISLSLAPVVRITCFLQICSSNVVPWTLTDVSVLDRALPEFFNNATLSNIPQSTAQLRFSPNSMLCLSQHIYLYFAEGNTGGKTPPQNRKPPLPDVRDSRWLKLRARS